MEQYSNKAIASLILGIISLICIWFSYSTLIGIACAIVGLIFSIQIRKAAQAEGFKPSGIATAGFILSIIGLALCVLGFIACVTCIGLFSAMAPALS